MPKECFDLLCSNIEAAVGAKAFCSHDFINTYLRSLDTPEGRMRNAAEAINGDYICGEAKVALVLRMMAGASYIDIVLIFGISYSHCYEIFHAVISNWICNDAVLPYLGEMYLTQDNEMGRTANEFATKGRHQGVIAGCIGALDGWLVRIRSPKRSDSVTNATSYFNRKGFFAINVQVLVDRSKRVIWRSIQSPGSEHDSSAFKSTGLYRKLMEENVNLLRKGLYIICDSAYAIRGFCIPPYDNAMPYSGEDNFNFYQSSCRIFVECTFGEIDMRWGIFWRPLQFTLQHNTKIIDAAMRLHNFIVDYRLDNPELFGYHREEREECEEEAELFQQNNPLDVIGVFVDERNGAPRDVGRPMSDEAESKYTGEQLRNVLRDQMIALDLRRIGREDQNTVTWFRDRFNRIREE